MAATTEQKVDFLLKKVGYSLSKTGSVTGTGAISGGTTKEPFAETLASPIATRSTSIWADSISIPATPPGSDTGYVKVYSKSAPVRMTADSTVAGSRAFIAYTTYNNTSSAILGDWINTQFGADYIIEVYRNDPSSGTEGADYFKLSAAGATGDDTWFFDYASGVLNFNGPDLPASVSDTNIYIVGYRYIGTKGVQPPGGIGTFHNLYVSGLSTFVGVGTFNSHLYVGGNLEVVGTTSLFGGTITLGDAATDNVVFNADVDSNIIPDDNNTYDLGSSSQRWKKIYVNNVGIGTSTVISDDITTRHLKVTGIGTFDQQLLVSGNVNVTGFSTFTELVDINGGGKANTFKVEDLTQYRVVLAGDGGEIEDNSKLTFDPASNLNVTGGLAVSGITTLGSIGISTGRITGPSVMYIDPATVGVAGTVIVLGNLQVDGTQTTVNSTTMTVDDKNIVIGQGAANDAAADGGGITLESSAGGNKTWNWVDATDSWTSSENIDIASGKVFKINTTSVLSNDTLGSGVVNSRLTSVGTLEHLKVNSGITTLSGSIITGVTTITQLQVGTTGQTLVGITTILDEDNMSSDSAAALATQQSIKKYVDDRTPGGPGGAALAVSADSGSNESIDLNTEVLDIEGTSNEIETVTGTNKVIIGLPDNVTIGNDLTVTSNAGIGSLAVSGISTFTSSINVTGVGSSVGIGTTNPTQKLEVYDGKILVRNKTDDAAKIILRDDSGSYNHYQIRNEDGTFKIRNSGASPQYDAISVLSTGNIGINSTIPTARLDVNGDTKLQGDLSVTGITTTLQLQVGTVGQTLVGITTILDEDNMASNSATALVTQQSVKAYVDTQISAEDLDFTGDTGSGSIDLDSQTFSFTGTPNEIVTTGAGQVLNIGLPDNVTVSGNLGVVGVTTSNTLQVGGAGVGVTISREGNLNVAGVSTFTSNVGVVGVITSNTLQVGGAGVGVTISREGNLNVAGISTFVGISTFPTSDVYIQQKLYVAGIEIGGPGGPGIGTDITTRHLRATGVSTFVGETNIGTGGTVFTALVGAAASVGIGSALPDYMLDVAGAINSETDVKIQGVSVTTQALNDAVAMAIALG